MKLNLSLKIVSIIGLSIWTVCCFLGLYYASDGNLMVAIPITLLIGVALFLSYLLMLKMQDNNVTEGNRDRAKTTSIIMLCVYVVVSLVSAFYINHLMKVETAFKSDVQEKAKNAIEELGNTFDDEKVDFHQASFRKYVDDQTGTYITQLKKQDRYQGERDAKIRNFKDYLLGEGEFSSYPDNYHNLENEVNEKLDEIYESVNNWNLFSVIDRLKDLEKNKEGWEKKVMAYSKAKECDSLPFLQNERFRNGQYLSEYDCSNLSKPLTHADFKLSVPAILIMVALQIIILLGYLLSLKGCEKTEKIVTDPHGPIRSYNPTNNTEP